MTRATRFTIGAAAAALTLQAGCAGARPRTAPDPCAATGAAPRPAERGSASVVTRQQLQASGATTAYEGLSRLRPELLTRRAPSVSPDPAASFPVVYLDGVRQGGVDMLKTIPVGMIAEIRYISPGAASDLFGLYYPGGVIAVRTQRPQR